MSRASLSGVLALVAISLAAAVFSSPAAAAAPPYSQTYTDPTGDSNTSPDVTGVSIANDATGMLTITVNVANRPTLLPGDAIILVVDSDHNRSTGESGLDAMVLLVARDDGSVQVAGARWTGSEFSVPITSSGPTGTFANGAATLTIAPSWLGPAPVVEVGVMAFDAAAMASSSATNGDLAGPYTFIFGGPAAAPKPAMDHLTSGAPRQGARFTVSARMTSGGRPVDPTETNGACRAKVAGKTVSAHAFWNELGTGTANYTTVIGCQIRVPKHSAGKRLTGSIQVTYLSKTTTRTFSYRIKK
jgi:hypothetical protein